MSYQYFVGIDVSKATLNVTLLKEGSLVLHQKIDNTLTAIKDCFKSLKKEHKAGGKTTLICLEHTGPYKTFLLRVLEKSKAGLWLESPLAIKRSLGLQRGKSDQVDAYRIARFAYLNRAHVRLYEPSRDIVLELKSLNGLRHRLQTALLSLQAPLRERQPFLKRHTDKRLMLCCAQTETALKADLGRTEEEMRELIQGDVHLHHLYEVITSVRFVGERLAIELLIATDEFKKFASAKALACYCGIAPFEHTSGTSLRGKTRVSPIANKRLKTMLHLPALSAVCHEGELRDYYLRKVAEGHPKMSVINAVKNKLLQRIFACVRDDRLYTPVMD